ncbi:hypothetical protein ACJRAE_001336 [Staphylococcus aureus]
MKYNTYNWNYKQISPCYIFKRVFLFFIFHCYILSCLIIDFWRYFYMINENQVFYYEIITLLNKRPLRQVDYGNKIQYLNFYHTELSNALFAIKFAH